MKKGIILVLFLMSCFYGSAQSTGKYQIKFLEVNKENSDYGVAILDNNKLIFTSALEKSNGNKKNYNPRKELYVGDIDFDGEITNIKPIATNTDEKYNQTGAAYSADKKTVYFSTNKYSKKLSKQKLPKNQRLELFKASVDPNGKWINIKKLPFNEENYSTGYPVLNADNSKLYFVSDRLPSQGKTDIFEVDVMADGSYSTPKNLGKNVNTSGNETTPFITEDGILYFSSDGHPGKGKLDVFAVEIFDNATSEIYQLAAPINSINDDFAYIINKDNNQGFFTSNRLQGQGFNDLYAFTLEKDVRPGECFISVDGKVKDIDTKEVIAGATVDLYNIEGTLLESVSTYNDGSYKFTVSCAKEYKLIASNEAYTNDEKRIEILEENYHSALHTNLNLSKIKEEKAEAIVESLQPIYYEFDDATITNSAAEEMDKIVKIMQTNPNLMIEASSFTDSRGSSAYNKTLSHRRAKAAVDYLTSQGISAKRIKSVGYGEEKLKNHCIDGVECDESAHQMNRRTEFNFMSSQVSIQKKKAPQLKEVAVAQKKSIPETKQPEKRKSEKTEVVTKTAPTQVEKRITTNKPEKTEVVVTTPPAQIKKPKSTNKAENYIEKEKLKVITNLSELETKYDIALADNSKVKDSILAEKIRIAKYKKNVEENKETGWSNIINYKNDLKVFNKRYNQFVLGETEKFSLNRNNPLYKRKDYYVQNSGKIKSEADLEREMDERDLAILEENLRIENVKVTAMKVNSMGKYQKTNSAKKTDLIKVSFKVLHNDKVSSGQKEAHIVLQNPEGKVAGAKGVFKTRDSSAEKKYTDHTTINYEKNDVDVVMFIESKGNYQERGIYPVKLFLEGQLVSVSNLNLQNAF